MTVNGTLTRTSNKTSINGAGSSNPVLTALQVILAEKGFMPTSVRVRNTNNVVTFAGVPLRLQPFDCGFFCGLIRRKIPGETDDGSITTHFQSQFTYPGNFESSVKDRRAQELFVEQLSERVPLGCDPAKFNTLHLIYRAAHTITTVPANVLRRSIRIDDPRLQLMRTVILETAADSSGSRLNNPVFREATSSLLTEHMGQMYASCLDQATIAKAVEHALNVIAGTANSNSYDQFVEASSQITSDIKQAAVLAVTRMRRLNYSIAVPGLLSREEIEAKCAELCDLVATKTAHRRRHKVSAMVRKPPATPIKIFNNV